MTFLIELVHSPNHLGNTKLLGNTINSILNSSDEIIYYNSLDYLFFLDNPLIDLDPKKKHRKVLEAAEIIAKGIKIKDSDVKARKFLVNRKQDLRSSTLNFNKLVEEEIIPLVKDKKLQRKLAKENIEGTRTTIKKMAEYFDSKYRVARSFEWQNIELFF